MWVTMTLPTKSHQSTPVLLTSSRIDVVLVAKVERHKFYKEMESCLELRPRNWPTLGCVDCVHLQSEQKITKAR